MTETYSTTIYRESDTASSSSVRVISLSVAADGSVSLDASDMGAIVKEWWGDDDYEFWVNVPAKAIHKLVFALLREKYSARSGAVDEFHAFCGKEGIENKWDSWI
jgi:hypothetical protein